MLLQREMLPPRGLAAQRPVSRKHLTQIIAVLALISNSSAACAAKLRLPLPQSRVHACPQNRPSASPASQKRINADRLSYPSTHENPPDSIGAEHALGGEEAVRPQRQAASTEKPVPTSASPTPLHN